MVRTEDEIERLCVKMLNAGRSFVGVQQVASRSRTMTLNARLAASKLGATGAAFSVVVQALDEVVAELSQLVGAVENARARAIRAVASFTWSENALRISRLALARHDDAETRTASSDDALEAGTGTRWLEALAASPAGSLAATLWDALVELRDEMLVGLHALQTASRELARLIESVEVLAASHGFFIGINGIIEAAYIGQGELTQLAGDLQTLTADIDVAVSVANDEAASLVLLADASTRSLRADISEAATRRERRERRDKEAVA